MDPHKRIVRHRTTIDATLEHGLSNGRIESTNTETRTLTRTPSGFTKPEAQVALATLALSGYCPPLPHHYLADSPRNDPRIGHGRPKSVPSVVCGADDHDIARKLPIYCPVAMERRA